MRIRTVEELRAIVGEDGREFSDEQLLDMDLKAARLADVVRGGYLDRVDPAGAAQRRRTGSVLAVERLRVERRRRYERERAAIGKTPKRRTA